MNYKKPVLEKLKLEYNLFITIPYLGLMLQRFKALVDYKFTNVDLLIDLEQGILIEEFVAMIKIIKSAKETINSL